MMKFERYEWLAITIMISLFIFVGFIQGWSVSLVILNMCIISAIMTMGVNISWGYAGVINFGVMGFLAMGGLAAVLVSYPPIAESWQAGGIGLGISFALLVVLVIAVMYINKTVIQKRNRYILNSLIIFFGILIIRHFYLNATHNIEDVNQAIEGFLGGLGLPIIFSWIVGGLFAAGVAFVIGKVALGLRSDYLAIATLGISEIIIYIIKNEEWLARGVKNVNGLPRPVPYEIDLQKNEFIQTLSNTLNLSVIELSSLIVKGLYSILFILVLLIIFFLLQKAIKSPWGRMMRAVRDNEISAEAMGINVKKRHLQVFIIGSAIIGISGAMLTTLDGQFTPSSYQPLRYTFLIWIMVIIGGSGNNHGAIIGGFAIWFFWIQAEPIGIFLIELITIFLSDQNEMKLYLLNHAAYMRLLLMGLVLILALRFFPKGIIEEEKRL